MKAAGHPAQHRRPAPQRAQDQAADRLLDRRLRLVPGCARRRVDEHRGRTQLTVDGHDPIGRVGDGSLVAGDQHGAAAIGHRPQGPQDHLRVARILMARRLIGQEHRRGRDRRSTHSDALLLPERDLSWKPPRLLGEIERFQCRLDMWSARGWSLPTQAQARARGSRPPTVRRRDRASCGTIVVDAHVRQRSPTAHSPVRTIRPPSSEHQPASSARSVLLPLPDRPCSTTSSPRFTCIVNGANPTAPPQCFSTASIVISRGTTGESLMPPSGRGRGG